MNKKTCGYCKEKKELKSYREDPRYKDGLVPLCRDCMASYNREYRKKNSNKPRPSELRISGVSKKTKEELNNIASNIGIPFPTFMKLELRKIISSYPENKRLPPLEY